MQWQDSGYLLYKNNFSENSIIADILTANHGRCVGVIYGGSSRKLKKYLQIGNKVSVIYKSKTEDKIGYFTIEIIKVVTPNFFDDKKKMSCILSAFTFLKILLPERQPNNKIFVLLENLINDLQNQKWILSYIFWELLLIKELGFDFDLSKAKILKKTSANQLNVCINNKYYDMPEFLISKKNVGITNKGIKKALIFNRNLLTECFSETNSIRIPLARNILENYYN